MKNLETLNKSLKSRPLCTRRMTASENPKPDIGTNLSKNHSTPKTPVRRVSLNKKHNNYFGTLDLRTPPTSCQKRKLLHHLNGVSKLHQTVSTPVIRDRCAILNLKMITPSPKGRFIFETPITVKSCDYYEMQCTKPFSRNKVSSTIDNEDADNHQFNFTLDQNDLIVKPDPKVFASEKIIPRIPKYTKKRTIPTPPTPPKRTKSIAVKTFWRRKDNKSKSKTYPSLFNLKIVPPNIDAESHNHVFVLKKYNKDHENTEVVRHAAHGGLGTPTNKHYQGTNTFTTPSNLTPVGSLKDRNSVMCNMYDYQFTPESATSSCSLDSIYTSICSESKDTFYHKDGVSKINIFAPSPLFLTNEVLAELFSEESNSSKRTQIIWRPMVDNNRDYILDKNFVVVRTIAEGPFSCVYLVKRRLVSDKYALKKSTSPSTGVYSALERINEARILAQIGRHKNCMETYFSWVQGGHFCMLSKAYFQDLAAFLDNNTCSKSDLHREATYIVADIGAALKFLHEKGIVHLDIKPNNILLDDGSYILSDFGLASFLPVKNGCIKEGDRVYLSPEIFKDDIITTSVDIFSLGLVTVEVAADVILPETGESWRALRNGNFSEIQLLTIQNEFSSLIRAMLHPQPFKRPAAGTIIENLFISSVLNERYNNKPSNAST